MSRWRRGVIASCGWCLGFWGDFGPWRLSRERGVLLFLKSCGALLSVRAELVEACSCWLGQHAWVEGGGRESPGMRVTFFCFAKRKSPKKRRPPVCDPFAVRRGKPAAGRLRGAPWNSLCCCAAPLGQPRRFSSRSTRAPTRVPPHNRPAAGAASRGWAAEHPNSHTGHCCARPYLAGASASRSAGWAERSNGPCGCPTRGLPSGCAWGAQGAGWHARRSAHAS